ncbi:Spermidine/putrescine import ATP-binding protein PotA [Achromobacter spanius]|uniref:ABC transporter ATP-binding protein n=1 Tax=Achromobacter spanius TaxID=217203 RepID=UPI000C2CCE24|nr:ABC transporter ATP-binding protein [Achromobacter spanius]AUA55600.1 ABC transporter ATP-binding protein [Achromobacter spanius]CAB3669056.1 Spermidine/putrescine import ATP-binding protein PotA [Achromobacter spanius]SPT36959.1 Spermidine/putrescine import ATP-binding protein PotA [Achromobacter denitrificans]VEE56906.1 Spermidine/putrescine import ATP-binding protein PotA [Achromobacter spanius]
MTYLVLNRLSKRYGETTAVQELSLSVNRGEFISLLGPSGCGKTTTLQMIAGFVEPTGGSIVLDGRDVSRVPANKRGLGLVFQNYALFPHMTVAENVSFGLEMQRVKKDEREARVADALKLVGLSHLADRHPAQMSGGQQQRVALARALVIRPSVLLLDEPLSNLDAKLREEMQLELRSIQRTIGTTTILVTHDQSEALALSDRIVVMNQGRVEQVAEPFQAYEGPASHFVGGFLGKANVFTPQAEHYENETRARIGEAHIPMAGAAVPQGAVIVRPEKILFSEPAACALPGRMKTRVFQGNHWLCQVDTSVGEVMVIRQNDGVPVPAEGETVHLRWRAQDMCEVASAPRGSAS